MGYAAVLALRNVETVGPARPSDLYYIPTRNACEILNADVVYSHFSIKISKIRDERTANCG